MTADGARIGTLHDLVADERTGDVVALEVSTRTHGARLTPPALVHAVGKIQLTHDIVVIPQNIAGTVTTDADAGDPTRYCVAGAWSRR